MSDSGSSSEQIENVGASAYQSVQLGPKTIELPADWDIGRIGDNTYLKGRIGWHGLTEEDHMEEGEYFLVTGTDFEGGRVQWDECVYVNQEWYERDENIQLEEGDLLLTKDGSIGKTALIEDLPHQATLNNGIFLIRPLEKAYLPKFMYYILNSKYMVDFINSITAGSTISHLYQKDFVNFHYPLPPIPEQRRIAAVLSTVDEQIRQTKEIIDTAEEVKKGLEQDLVLGRGLANEYQKMKLGPRTVEVPADWTRSTFSDVASIEKGNTPKTSNDEYYGGDIVWVTPDDLSTLYEEGDGKYIDDSRRKLTKAGLESTSVYIVEPNSVMFTSRSYGIGKTAICTVPAATNQGIIAFNPNSHMSAEYLYYYLNWIMDYIISLSGVSTFPEVSKSDVESISVPVPTPEHQERISEVLRQADEKITREQEQKQKLQELKRGLMQDLLTGKVRTPPDLLD